MGEAPAAEAAGERSFGGGICLVLSIFRSNVRLAVGRYPVLPRSHSDACRCH